MGQLEKARIKRLWRAVDEVLFYVWDPIGVGPEPRARDEYSSYVPQIVDLLLTGAGSEEVGNLLATIATERMELEISQDRRLAAVSCMLEWRSVLAEEVR